MNEPRPLRSAVVTGWWLLAISLPLGLTLEALHAWKVELYLGSALRREMWRLAHAHGNLLALVLLAFAGLAPRWIAPPAHAGIARLLRAGAVAMPLGFFLGGIGNSEGDPSWGILLVPLGALALLVGLARCALATTGGEEPGANASSSESPTAG